MSLNKAIEILNEGGAIVYPTDTAYGLGVDVTDSKSVKLMYKIKKRGNQPTHIMVNSLEMAEEFVEFSSTAKQIFRKFLPGPLTLILPLKKNVTKSVKILSAGKETLGIRMPNNKIALSLAKNFGRPITTSSANPAGGETPYSIKTSKKQFEGNEYQPDYYLDGGSLEKITPSTMVSVVGRKVGILREGPITKKEIFGFLNRENKS